MIEGAIPVSIKKISWLNIIGRIEMRRKKPPQIITLKINVRRI
jgi:hypothetical protein